MSNYTKATNFTTKDSLTTGNALKVLSGTELDDEFNAIQVSNNTKANASNAQLTGVPVAPTAAANTNTTQLATTAFVTTEANLKSDIASPTFTGVPAGPTASADTSTTQLATTAFVTTEANLKTDKASNLSDLANAGTARTNLGVAIGSNVQAYDSDTAKTDVAQTFSATQTFAAVVADSIALGGTGSANTLDDYEEGTWTPAGFGITYSTAVGRYTKIGDTVTWSAHLDFPNTSDGNTIRVTLPFTLAAGNNNRGNATLGYQSSYVNNLTVLQQASTNYAALYTVGGAVVTNNTLSTKTIFIGGLFKV